LFLSSNRHFDVYRVATARDTPAPPKANAAVLPSIFWQQLARRPHREIIRASDGSAGLANIYSLDRTERTPAGSRAGRWVWKPKAAEAASRLLARWLGHRALPNLHPNSIIVVGYHA